MQKINWHHTGLRVIFAAIALVAVFALFHYVLEPYMPRVDNFVIALGNWGPVLFIVFFIVCTAFFFPETIFALAAGAIFGIWWGLLWVVIAGTLSAFLMFFIGRNVLKNPVQSLLCKHPKLQAIDKAASSFKMIALLRLSPFNFTALSYLVSVSKANFSSYAYASIALVPGFLSSTYIGFAAKHAADLAAEYKLTHQLPTGDSLAQEFIMYVGLLVAVTVSVIIAKVALKTVKNYSSSESPK
ncbi:MAG: putative membrane protein YdjX (TVP38/TMEM64 family) [Phycisphaerales bacterium]